MKNIKIYESFLNEGYVYGKFSKEDVSRKGLKNVITGDFFLDLWFDSYFKNTTGDSSYDYRKDEDFWNHTDEILGTENVSDEDADILHDERWATVLSYIDLKRPNPLTLNDSLEDTIKAALSY